MEKLAEKLHQLLENMEKDNIRRCIDCGIQIDEGELCFECSKKRYKILIFGGKQILNLTFDKFEVNEKNKSIVETLKNYNYKTENLYIYGKCGVGKSHLAGAILNNLIDNNRINIEYKNLISLSRNIRGKESYEEEEIIQQMINSDVFILDELVGKLTEFSIQILYEIIEGKIRNEQNGIIITANLSLDDLAEKIQDDRLSSRIVGISKIIHLEGEDYRLKRR